MTFEQTTLPGATLITPAVFGDSRGFFLESYSRREFAKHGIDTEFVQDNHSRSVRGVLRGLHFQTPPHAQAKLVRCVRGEIWDVIVDIRIGSPTYGAWEGFTLSEENKRMLFVPRGFAHGFITVSDIAEVVYKADNYYAPLSEGGVAWNDPVLNVRWPLTQPSLSSKDTLLGPLCDLRSPFTYNNAAGA